MNLTKELSTTDKSIATKNILKGNGSATLINLKKEATLAKQSILLL